jgi:hypothetical protein
MMSSAIFTANLPMLVPPNFWTSHLADGSIVFWCMFGGVLGREENEEDLEDEGVDEEGITENFVSKGGEII